MSTSPIALRTVRRSLVAALLAVLALTRPHEGIRAQGNSSPLTGQSVTLLPDGRELWLGGIAADGTQRWGWIREKTGRMTASIALTHPRAWHTATVLADGTVLVLGGVGADGTLVSPIERIELATGGSTVLPQLTWNPRFGHTATLVDRHRLVLTGGVRDERYLPAVELIDLGTWTVASIATLNPGRAFHSARLLGDGTIELWGGQTADGPPVFPGAVIDTRSGAMRDIVIPELDEAVPWLAASDPPFGASDVPPAPTIMLRFTRPARVETVSGQTVTLDGAGRRIEVVVVPAEGGRLAFVTPRERLETGSYYTITGDGLRDTGGAPFPRLSVVFSTQARADTRAISPEGEDWEPMREGPQPSWRAGGRDSRWQDIAPLTAAAGQTALGGHVLRLNGAPLAGVTLTINGQSAVTDTSGRFLLVLNQVATGWHELRMDGRTTPGSGATYGTFEAAVHVTAGVTTTLPYTIWMPKIDTANAVRIDSPTTTDTVITTPKIPGLELRLPPGTVISDEDGRIVREVSITPIPIDRTPFPLPDGVDVPIYFTIQPGGTYVAVTGSGERRGAQLVYPNYRAYPAGTRMEFWHYNPREGRRWSVYGQGTVTAGGAQVAPDAGVSLYEFTGAMIAPPGLAGPSGPAPGDPGNDGDPVHLGTGQFVLNYTDLALPDVLPVAVERTHRQNDTISRSFGIGASHQYDIFLTGDTTPYTYMDLILPDGGRVHYDRITPGTSFLDAIYEHTSSPTIYFKSRIYWSGSGWSLDLKNGTRIRFPDGLGASRSSQAAAVRIEDRYGNAVVFVRSSGDLTKVTSPNGRWIEFTYDTSHRVTQARDNTNRIVEYTYNASGRLWKVTDAADGVTEYTYDAANRLHTIKDPRGIVYLTNEYDANGRVFRQTQADTTTFEFAYLLDGAGNVTRTDVTNPRGHVRRSTYSVTGYLLTDTFALGQPEEQTVTYERQAGTNLPLAIIDALGRRTSFTYDPAGMVTSITRLAGTPNAVTETFTYEPTFNQLATHTDPLTHTTTFDYDTIGNITTITDPLTRTTTLTYNGQGRPLTITTAAGTTEFTYDGAHVETIESPAGGITTHTVDGAGRITQVTSPLDHSTHYEYDALNRLTKTINALGGETVFGYDPNGNLLTVKDARNNTTTYVYDNMDRVETRTDPLSRTESYLYDANGNLRQVTDRKNQVTTYTYDRLDRLASIAYADSSSTVNTYDDGDRLTQVSDSLAGTITRTYDGLDRLTQEVTPEGTVTYTYDAANRRATMTVAGQPQVVYGYDNGNALTSITQGSSVVGFTYDNAGRRATLTLPNGIVTTYGYDAASRLTSLTYQLGQTTLGDLTYGYDLAGRRTSVGGSWARTSLPPALNVSTYDAANQIATWAGTPFTYDANGNLTSDGSKTYTWNARDQLTGIGGGATANFTYDGVGRRRAKTIGGVASGFLYDGLNTVQELAGGAPSANILSGGLDEWLLRTDAAGPRQFLRSALGSTVALADNLGAVQTEYTFEPFGKATATGGSSSNSFKFTGREDDGTGLLFYRARYYDPSRQRFLSEDPIGFGGGDANLYAYTFNSPTNFTDPTGQIVPAIAVPLAQCMKGAGFDVGTSLLEGLLGGRKRPGMGDLLKTALAGCLSDLVNPFDRLGDVARMADNLSPAARKALDAIKEWLGPGARTVRNKNGDLVAISQDGARRVRFDINNPHPHQSPHSHVEWLENGDWVGPRIFPPDVPPR